MGRSTVLFSDEPMLVSAERRPTTDASGQASGPNLNLNKWANMPHT